MAFNIGVIHGDGTGPEVVTEAIKVLKSLESNQRQFTFSNLPYDGTRYLKTGELLSDQELQDLNQYDALLLGAIGHTEIKPGVLERGILLKLRFGLDQYINLRPIKLYKGVETPLKNKTHEDIDYVVIRENSAGLYTGKGQSLNTGTDNESTEQVMEYSYQQVERCIRYAFEYTVKRHQDSPWKGLSDADKQQGYVGQLTLCGKTNVLQYVFGLWDRVFNEVASEFPTIKTNYVHVDATCIYMIESPHQFDTIVTSNMFGDIITDLAAVTQGGMGVAPGGNINPSGTSMFEPIGGTAPAFTGKNEINPLACIGAAGLMLDHLGDSEGAKIIDQAIADTVLKMDSMAAGKMGFSTTEIGDMVSEYAQKVAIPS